MQSKHKFLYQVIVKFSELSENLNNVIRKKLNENSYLDLAFEVIKVNSFTIKETKVAENNCISCKLVIYADCINPEIGKVFTIDTKNLVASKTKNKYILSIGRVQIICESDQDIYNKNVVSIRIEQTKIFFKHILCVAKVLN